MADMENWIEFNSRLRKRVARKENGENQFLLASFVGTEQQKDIEKRTALIGDYFRAKINVKAFDDGERAKKNLPPLDFHNDQEVFNALKKEFDMPYWALNSIHKPLKDLKNTFIYQLVACNYNCPWCYVDDINKNPSAHGAKFFSTREVVDVFKQEQEKQPLYNIRPSGGEPTLMIEQWLEVLKEIDKRSLTAYMQGDTNLSTGHFLERLEEKGEIENHLLEKVASFSNVGVLCSFKGTDKESFLKAAGMPKKYDFLEEERWYTFSKMLRAGIDAYPFVYDPDPVTLESFMEKGAEKFGDGFYLKTWVLPIKLYGPEIERLKRSGASPEAYQKQLDFNFNASTEIMQRLIWRKFGLNYQAVPRTGPKLKVQE